MNSLDLILVLVMLAFGAIGALRGVLRESLSLLVWAMSILMAWLFADSAATWFESLQDPLLPQMLGFAVVFAVTFIVMSVGAFALRVMLLVTAPDMKARIVGSLLGAARGGMMAVILVLLAGLTSFPQNTLWQESELIVYFQSAALAVRDTLPPEVARQIRYG
jgi:membrane protein required for colicin V production